MILVTKQELTCYKNQSIQTNQTKTTSDYADPL